MKLNTQLSRWGAGYILYGILTLFVLKMDTYFDMEEYKCAAFAGIVVLGGVVYLAGLPKAKGLRRWQRDSTTVWALVLGGSLILSQLLSTGGENSLWGSNSYYMGTIFMLACLAIYLMLKHGVDRQMVRCAVGLFLIAGLLANLLGIVNQYGWDPLGVTSMLIASQRGVYFTTIGQMNFVGFLLTMWLSVAVGGFLFSKRPLSSPQNWLTWGCAFFGFWGMMLFNADGYLLGALGLLAGCICLRRFDTKVLERLALLGAAFWCASLIGVGLTNIWPTDQNLPLISGAGKPALALPGWALSVLLFLLLRRWHSGHSPKPLYLAGRVLCVGVVVVLLIGVVLASTVYADVQLTGAAKYLQFNEDWGTHRGACWIALFRIFAGGDFIYKLFGWGAASTHTLIMVHQTDWADIEYNISGFYAAHNEYLEQLMSSGIVGLVAWLGLLISNLRRGMKAAQENTLAAVLTVAVFAYSVEAFTNIRTCIVFPVFIVLLGALSAVTSTESRPARPTKTFVWETGGILLAVFLTSFLWQSIGTAIVPF